MPMTSLPTYNPSNPFYDPTHSYGNPGGGAWKDDWLNIGYQVGETDQSAAWTKHLAEMGYGGMDNKSTFMRALYGRAQEGYGASRMQAPGLTWQDYLKTADLERLWQDSSPIARGDTSANYAPNARWQRRAY